jgi:hypothetical protein
MGTGESSALRAFDRVDVDRLADVITRMERGDEIPLNPAWLGEIPPLSDAQRGQLKGAFARARLLQPPLSCMAPTDPPCERPPIESHSMQRGGPLSLLAEDHMVLVLRYSQCASQGFRALAGFHRSRVADHFALLR